MNYRRGFQRLFAVLALCWYVGAVFILWPSWSKVIIAQRRAQDAVVSVMAGEAKSMQGWTIINPKVKGAPQPPPGYVLDISPERFLAEKAVQEAKDQRPILPTVAFVLIPPCVYALGIASLWVVNGFRGGTQI